MAYIVSIALLVAGVLVLVAVMVRIRPAVRRFTIAADTVNTQFNKESGMLRARLAALGVAMAELRRRAPAEQREDGSTRVPSRDRERQEANRG